MGPHDTLRFTCFIFWGCRKGATKSETSPKGDLLLELIRSFRGGMLRVDSNIRATMFRALRYLVRASWVYLILVLVSYVHIDSQRIAVRVIQCTRTSYMRLGRLNMDSGPCPKQTLSTGAHKRGCRSDQEAALWSFYRLGASPGTVRVVGTHAGDLYFCSTSVKRWSRRRPAVSHAKWLRVLQLYTRTSYDNYLILLL